jgi:hypothetical protein
MALLDYSATMSCGEIAGKGKFMKTLTFNKRQIKIQDPSCVDFENDFDREIYHLIYSHISSGTEYKPVIDTDDIYENKHALDVVALAESCGLTVKQPSAKASNKGRALVQYLIRDFLARHPIFMGLIYNNVALAEIAIQNAEELLGEKVDVTNFIEIKSIIDTVNRNGWSRNQDESESQSGTSTLGTISENLLKKTFDALVDGKDFFQGESE